MEADKVIAEELARRLPDWEMLPESLYPVLEQHCDLLKGLVASLQVAGREPAMIRSLVSSLLESYGNDLIAALEATS